MIKYTVIIHEQEDEDGDVADGYWAEVRECPGCVSQGDTLEEMFQMVGEALSLWLEVKAEKGSENDENKPWSHSHVGN